MDCNGFKLKGLNPDCRRVAVKSSVQTSWFIGYNKRSLWRDPVAHDVGMNKDEIIVIANQDSTGTPVIELEPLGDKVGSIIAQSSRGERTRNGKSVGGGTKVLRVGGKYRFELEPGESIVLRGSRIMYPNNMGAGMSV